MVTAKDVAHKAGVSTTTVSHVINETRFVSQALRARVYQAMEELNYRPNAVARSLRCQKTHNIAVIVPDIAYPFLAELARGIEDEAFKQGYNSIVCESNTDAEREAACVELMQSKQADGIVFIGTGASSHHVQNLIAQKIPVVVCNQDLGLPVDTVIADNVASGDRATQHLIQAGHRHIGCIAGPRQLYVSVQRVQGYRRALEARGLPWNEAWVVHGDFRCRGGYDAMYKLLALDPPPTAVFAGNDMMAMGAICAASKEKLDIPGDVAIVGCDDIALAAFTNPSLTTITQPKREMGALAVQMLVQRIADPDKPPEKHTLPVTLTVRDSG
jgi:LacI family transcriptional regulator